MAVGKIKQKAGCSANSVLGLSASLSCQCPVSASQARQDRSDAEKIM